MASLILKTFFFSLVVVLIQAINVYEIFGWRVNRLVFLVKIVLIFLYFSVRSARDSRSHYVMSSLVACVWWEAAATGASSKFVAVSSPALAKHTNNNQRKTALHKRTRL